MGDNVLILLGRVHNRLGGAGRTVEGYAQGYLEVGRTVTVAGLGSEAAIRSGLSLDETVSVVPLEGNKWCTAVSIFRLLRRQRAGVTVMVGVWHFPFFVVATCNIRRWLCRNRSDKSLVLVPTMSLTRYDRMKRRLPKLLLMPLVQLLLRSYDAVAFSSRGEKLQSDLPKHVSSTVILEPSRFTAHVGESRYSSSNHSTKDVTFVGRLDPQKDIPLLFQAFAAVQEEGVALNVVGDGPRDYAAYLQQVAADLGIASSVRWLGWQNIEGVADVLASSRVVAVTSVDENYCHVAIEGVIAKREVVIVDRILSSPDLAVFPSVQVVSPSPSSIAAAIDDRIRQWPTRVELREQAALQANHICSPLAAAQALDAIIGNRG